MIEIFDIRKCKVKHSTQISEEPILYGMKCVGKGNKVQKQIWLGTEDGRSIFLDQTLAVLKDSKVTDQVIQSLEETQDILFYGLKSGQVKVAKLDPNTSKKSTKISDKENINALKQDQMGNSKKQYYRTFQAHKEGINVLQFSEQKQILISGSKCGNIHFWDKQKNWEFLSNGVGLKDQVSCLKLEEDSNLLAAGSWDQTIAVYNF